MSSFKDLRIVDNFYQTSSFFPMPTVLGGTIAENGKTNLSPTTGSTSARRCASASPGTRRTKR